jgi:predicted Kef-type K+ transport protein
MEALPHETELFATIAVGLSAAFVGGLIAHRFRLPTLIGYLLAGVAMGTALGLLPVEGHNLILAGALVSITLNPLLFAAIDPWRDRMTRRSRQARQLSDA